jgi:glutamate-1-semialdehyde 2,1-aminomutase
LIFDEVITGFRVHPGGAQGHYDVRPDLTTLAKVLAGGLPGGCVAGRADILAALEFRPGKPKMKHPGTFNANPLSAAAGCAALRLVATGEPSRRATDLARLLRQRLNSTFESRQANWIAYGEFSGWKLLTDYRGPRPTGDDFIPYDGDIEKLDPSAAGEDAADPPAQSRGEVIRQCCPIAAEKAHIAFSQGDKATADVREMRGLSGVRGIDERQIAGL